jgi:signal transduction histidine kinase
MVLAGFVSTMISATFGVTILWLAGFAQVQDLGPIWLTWWLGDAAGAVVVAPAVLLWLASPRPTWAPAQISEAAALGAVIALVGAIVFGDFLLPPGRGYALSFLCLPPAIWAAFRFGTRGTATTVLFLSAIAIWGSLSGSGPFPGRSENESLLLLQGFMIVLSVTASSLAATVSEYRRTLGDLGSRTIELARSNADLEQYAHVVSHDLKAPLRGISSLASWIAEDCKDVLPDESRERLGLVVERAKRMSRLIDGVLAYSRVSRTRSVSELVDPREVLEEVIDLLGPPDHVSVRIEGAFPVIWHDRTQLTQVFQNLIGNALQHLGKPCGTVVVSCRARAGEIEFGVCDDGVGIHERHLERIFRMFQTLDPNKETTGIGLSVVKKIVEMHGGSISVESSVGAGTTFRFTVPKPATRRAGARSGSTPPPSADRA